MKEIISGYRIAGKFPKGNFKRLIIGVIDFDQGNNHYLQAMPCLHGCRYLGSVWNCEPVPLSLLNFTEWEETY